MNANQRAVKANRIFKGIMDRRDSSTPPGVNVFHGDPVVENSLMILCDVEAEAHYQSAEGCSYRKSRSQS